MSARNIYLWMIVVKSYAIALIVTAATVATVAGGVSRLDGNSHSSPPLGSAAVQSQTKIAGDSSGTPKSAVPSAAGASPTAAGVSPVQTEPISAVVENNDKANKVLSGDPRKGQPSGGDVITLPGDRIPKFATQKFISVAQDTSGAQRVAEDRKKITDSEKLVHKDITAESEVNVEETNVGIQRYQDSIRPTAKSAGAPPEKMYTERVISMGLAPSIYDEDSHMFILFTVGMLLCAAGYVAYHNKRKILALIIEGRNPYGETRRGGGKINYKRVNTYDTGSYGQTVSVA